MAIRAAGAGGALEGLLAVPFFDHVGDVYARLELAAGTDEELWWVKLAVLVHEQPIGAGVAALARAGFADVEPRVRAVLDGFGRLWKVQRASEMRAFVRECGDMLAPLLLFELAHEGSPTERMLEAARAGGVEAQLRRWIEPRSC